MILADLRKTIEELGATLTIMQEQMESTQYDIERLERDAHNHRNYLDD